MTRSVAFALLLCPALAAAQTPAAAPVPPQRLPADSLAIARRYVGWLFTSQFDSLRAAMTPEGQANMSLTEMSEGWARFTSNVGVEAELVEERWVRRNGLRQFWRVARFTDFTSEPVAVRLVILPDGRLGGLGMNPLSRVPPIDPEP